MNYGRTIGLVLAGALGASVCSALAGCGGKQTTSVDNRGVTVGEELQDLEKARSDGLITEKEYQEQREAILKRSKGK